MPKTNVKNRNYQSPLTFDFRVDRLPDFNYFVQRVNVPEISIGVASVQGATPFTRIPWQGDHMEFGHLSIDFKISEGLRNWFEIYNWMKGISFPTKQKEYGDLKIGEDTNLDGEKRRPLPWPVAQGHIYGQASLLIGTSHNNPFLSFQFIDIYPTNLSELVLDTRANDVEFLTGTVVFRYDYYTVEKIK